MRDLPNLDLLRAIAVLSVVAEHLLLAFGVQTIGYWQIRWMGVVGVFLFFVHTSLVLMWSLERKPHTLDFYIRRVFRIYPLAMVTVLVTVGLHAPVSGSAMSYFHYAAPPSLANLLASLLLIPNLVGNYQPVSVLWSLPYEVDMYVCLPLLFFFLQRNLSLPPLLVFWGLEIAVCRPLFPGATHNFLLAVPYFLPGVMAYVLFSRHRARLPAWLFLPGLLLLWAVFMVHPGWREGDVLCLAAGLGLPLFRQIRTGWLKRVSHEIAKYSYGMYLAHPFAIVLGVYLLPHRSLVLQLLVTLGSVAVLSVSSYYLLERPLMRVGSRVAQRAERAFEQREFGKTRIPEAEIQ
ncbi:MAG: acyltransferase family protein [Janthinobacterium lividum]